MVAPTPEMAPLEYLARADREFAAGNCRQSAFLFWKATEAVFVEMARSGGWESGDLIAVAKGLESDKSVPKYYFRGALSTGTLLRDHAEMDVLEDCEVEFACFVAREFIRRRY